MMGEKSLSFGEEKKSNQINYVVNELKCFPSLANHGRRKTELS
jgi:hypothetical protein